MSDELKPCPFCGNKEIDYGMMTGPMHGWAYVQCEECLAEIHVNSPIIEKAVKAWNKRAAQPERKKGKWKPFDSAWGRNLYLCSVCGDLAEMPTVMGKPTYRFCPSCGAKMEVMDED